MTPQSPMAEHSNIVLPQCSRSGAASRTHGLVRQCGRQSCCLGLANLRSSDSNPGRRVATRLSAIECTARNRAKVGRGEQLVKAPAWNRVSRATATIDATWTTGSRSRKSSFDSPVTRRECRFSDRPQPRACQRIRRISLEGLRSRKHPTASPPISRREYSAIGSP